MIPEDATGEMLECEHCNGHFWWPDSCGKAPSTCHDCTVSDLASRVAELENQVRRNESRTYSANERLDNLEPKCSCDHAEIERKAKMWILEVIRWGIGLKQLDGTILPDVRTGLNMCSDIVDHELAALKGADESSSLAEKKAFLALPIEERRRIMAEQASKLEADDES